MVIPVLFIVAAMFCSDKASAEVLTAFSDALSKEANTDAFATKYTLWQSAKYICWLAAIVSAYFL